MICEIEELGTKFESDSLGCLKLLKQREIEAMKAGTVDLTARSAQRRQIGLPVDGDDRGIGERRRIHPLIDIVFSAERVLARHKQRHTTHTGGRSNIAGNGKRLAVLKRQNAVHPPSADNLVHQTPAGRKKRLSFPKGEIITAAEMKNMANIGIAGAIVDLRSQPGSAVRNGGGVELIDSVGAATRPGEVSEKAEPMAKLMLQVVCRA